MSRPLEGRRVVVTRPLEKAEHLSELLRERGAEVIHYPTISIADPNSWAELDAALEGLRGGGYEWIVFTSVNAVEKVLSRLSDHNLLNSTKVAAVGKATHDALRQRRITVDLVPEDFTGEALARELGEGSGRILLPRVGGAPQSTVSALEQQGWSVDEVIAYRNVMPNPSSGSALGAEDFDVVTFASGSAARNFAVMHNSDEVGLAPEAETKKIVACIGPKTAEEARAAGMRVDLVASVHTDEGLVTALEQHVASRPLI